MAPSTSASSGTGGAPLTTASSSLSHAQYQHNPNYVEDDERLASKSPARTNPYIRAPPPPHQLNQRITTDDLLFQTIHFAPAPEIDLERYRLVLDVGGVHSSTADEDDGEDGEDVGNIMPREATTLTPKDPTNLLVTDVSSERTVAVSIPLILTLEDLKSLPSTTITSFHECYGPPTLKPDTNRWRVGCVTWRGVRLRDLLSLAGLDISLLTNLNTSRDLYIYADGLDKGTFAGSTSDRYRKDIPLAKAVREEVLVAYEMNGHQLSPNRGGPVRLVVTGWFGTCSVKWLCRVMVRRGRAEGMFARGRFYNEEVRPDIGAGTGKGRREGGNGDEAVKRQQGWWEKQTENGRVWMKPLWKIDVNSLIFTPRPDDVFPLETGQEETEIQIEGWAWSDPGVKTVEISFDSGEMWERASVEERTGYSWQQFTHNVTLGRGEWRVTARAECQSGEKQPLVGRRNHVHSVSFTIE